MSEPELVAIKVSSILTCLLWTKVFATNIGLGGAKKNAGQRAPEDKYQTNEADADLYENWPYYVYSISAKNDPNQYNELGQLQDFSTEQELTS